MKIKISYLKLETNAAIVESVTVLIILVKFLSLTITTIVVAESCKIPAIYNFGDSNSDTGSDSSVFGRVSSPNGITYFGKPSGRYCDGRLIIDFIGNSFHFICLHFLMFKFISLQKKSLSLNLFDYHMRSSGFRIIDDDILRSLWMNVVFQ